MVLYSYVGSDEKMNHERHRFVCRFHSDSKYLSNTEMISG